MLMNVLDRDVMDDLLWRKKPYYQNPFIFTINNGKSSHPYKNLTNTTIVTGHLPKTFTTTLSDGCKLKSIWMTDHIEQVNLYISIDTSGWINALYMEST
jgi:hypothetical protein